MLHKQDMNSKQLGKNILIGILPSILFSQVVNSLVSPTPPKNTSNNNLKNNIRKTDNVSGLHLYTSKKEEDSSASEHPILKVYFKRK